MNINSDQLLALLGQLYVEGVLLRAEVDDLRAKLAAAVPASPVAPPSALTSADTGKGCGP